MKSPQAEQAISESVSENRKRGRPRSSWRLSADSLPEAHSQVACLRTRVNWCLVSSFGKTLVQAAPEVIVAILGAGPRLPRGYRGAALEAARFIVAGGKAENVIAVMAEARQKGETFRRIAEHIRRTRLGWRPDPGLLDYLLKARDRYLARFPVTTKKDQLRSVDFLRAVIESLPD